MNLGQIRALDLPDSTPVFLDGFASKDRVSGSVVAILTVTEHFAGTRRDDPPAVISSPERRVLILTR
jgi:hypothetical protein